MTLKHQFIALAVACLGSTGLADPYEPDRGSAERSAILDALRPIVENDLGKPVEFVVNTMQIDGDRGFLGLLAQRPGGGVIDLPQTPMVVRDNQPLWSIDGPSVTAFVYQSAGGQWTVDAYSVGATDVWWAGGPYCENYASLLPAFACP